MSGVFHDSFKSVLGKIGCFKGVFSGFQRYLEEVQRQFQVSFKCVSRKLKGVSRKIEGCFNGVLSGFQGCLKEVHWVFEEIFKNVSRMFQGFFKGVSWKIEWCSLRPPPW